MKRLSIATALFLAFAAPTAAHAEQIQATLSGYQEVPSVSTAGGGEFRAMIGRDDQSIDYELTYSGLEGAVAQAHIHVGQAGVNGSIVIWLCQTPGTQAPAAVRDLTPQCEQSGTVTGQITEANVIAASTTSQRILAGELAEAIAAIRAGVAYANVHTLPLNGGGEIRGQIRASSKR